MWGYNYSVTSIKYIYVSFLKKFDYYRRAVFFSYRICFSQIDMLTKFKFTKFFPSINNLLYELSFNFSQLNMKY